MSVRMEHTAARSGSSEARRRGCGSSYVRVNGLVISLVVCLSSD